MIVFVTTIEQAVGSEGEFRAGGTDLQERRHAETSEGDIVDLRDLVGLDEVRSDAGGGLRLGAKVRIAQAADHEMVRAGYPGLAEAAGGLATPQIRAAATLGGNLLQHNRCWYYRAPHVHCFKRGGKTCPARAGDHLHLACFDRGPCVCVHPSTLGMALLAYDAKIEVAGADDRTIEALYGDGSDPTRDHRLEPGALLTAVVLPAPAAGERSAYFRTIGRAQSEWPLVEVLARLVVEGDRITAARVAMGGVAPVPLRLPRVEAALMGAPAEQASLEGAAKLASSGATPLPMTGYKVDLVEGTVLEALERALARDSATLEEPT
jgi:xanthine dehydrogenase YagS FAD-binding subunit